MRIEPRARKAFEYDSMALDLHQEGLRDPQSRVQYWRAAHARSCYWDEVCEASMVVPERGQSQWPQLDRP